MTRNEFLNQLNSELGFLEYDRRMKMLERYEKLLSGVADEDIVTTFGTPRQIAERIYMNKDSSNESAHDGYFSSTESRSGETSGAQSSGRVYNNTPPPTRNTDNSVNNWAKLLIALIILPFALPFILAGIAFVFCAVIAAVLFCISIIVCIVVMFITGIRLIVTCASPTIADTFLNLGIGLALTGIGGMLLYFIPVYLIKGVIKLIVCGTNAVSRALNKRGN